MIIYCDVKYEQDLQIEVDKFTSFYAATDEKHNPNDEKSNLKNIKTRGIEVETWHFGQKYSNPMKDIKSVIVMVKTYLYIWDHGVGLSRLVELL